MRLTVGSTAYDLLAYLCSCIPKEYERKIAIKWKNAKRYNVRF